MKRLAILLTISLMLFCGCGSMVRTNVLDSHGLSLDENTGVSSAEISGFDGWIMAINGTSILICSGAGSSELFWVSTADIPIVDSNGGTVAFSSLAVGDTVEISYDGGILETFPSMFSGISGIRMTGRRSTLVPFYSGVLGDIYELDGALNADISLLAFDLTHATNMTEGEKSAFVYLAGETYGMESFFATYNDLKERGYLADEGLTFEDGLLITITVAETSRENGFEFSISKWRSGNGAVGYSECIATKKNDAWSYEAGGAWIS